MSSNCGSAAPSGPLKVDVRWFSAVAISREPQRPFHRCAVLKRMKLQHTNFRATRLPHRLIGGSPSQTGNRSVGVAFGRLSGGDSTTRPVPRWRESAAKLFSGNRERGTHTEEWFSYLNLMNLKRTGVSSIFNGWYVPSHQPLLHLTTQ